MPGQGWQRLTLSLIHIFNFTDRLGGSGNQVKARFVTRHYVGEYIRYHFETASGSELVVKNLNDSSAPHLSAHDEVALAWLPEDSQALDRSEVPPHN